MQKKPTDQKPKKKESHIKTMDVCLVVIAIALLAFTVEMIRLFRETGMIPDTLVTCVFAALGGECGAMAWIKTAKERNKDRKWQQEDQAHMEELERENTQNQMDKPANKKSIGR